MSSSRPLFRSDLSQISFGRRSCVVSAPSEAVAELTSRDAGFDIEAIFRAQYERIARVIARVVRDRARAEELAVEVFLKLWRNERAQGENTEGWLYRVAVRAGLDELRRHARRTRYESLTGFGRATLTPEQIHAATEEQEKVRAVLATIERRQSELLLLRNNGLSYEEVADALELNPASVGTLLSRAQQAFRKEYIKRYGEQ
jgi:RNA polymerase sigma-70 factor, ECF subfamily